MRVLCLLLLIAASALAHDSSGPHRPEQVASIFVSALLSGYSDEVEALIDPDFTVAGGGFTGPVTLNKHQFLQSVLPTGVEISGIRQQHARLQQQGDKARLGPLIIYLGDGDMAVLAMSLDLVRREQGWKIAGLNYSSTMPDDVILPVPPSPQPHYAVTFRVQSEGQSVASRISLQDQNGTSWVPEGRRRTVPTGWRQDVGAGVVIAGRQYSYVPGEFSAQLPAGQYHLRLERGMEYVPLETVIQVQAGSQQFDLQLQRWVNMNTRGWRSGDTHIHFLDPTTALLEASGEGLNVANVLATQWGSLRTNAEHFTGVPHLSLNGEHQVFVNEELRHGFLGHAVLLNLKRLVYPMSWGGPGEGVPGGYDFPLIAMQSDVVRAQGGFVAAAHLPLHPGELAADAVLGKLDAVELMVWGNPFAPYHKGYSASQLYYALLNAGIPMPAVAGTDKMMNLQTVGSVRTYARAGDDKSYQGWIDSVRAGKTFVTTGPMLDLNVTQGIQILGIGDTLTQTGEILIDARVESFLPVDSLELIHNGRVITSMQNPGKERMLSLKHRMDVEQGGWIAVRALSSKRLPYQTWQTLTPEGIELMAHSSPIYLKPGGTVWREKKSLKLLRKMADKGFAWSRDKANVRLPTERESMTAFFKRAVSRYDVWLSEVQ